MNILDILGRNSLLFEEDISRHQKELLELVQDSRFLVIGGAGTIGQAVTREIFKRKPKALHAIDISENNLVELVRDLRSTLGYIDGDFRTFALDCASLEYDALLNSEAGYDYVLNLSALKHVRSEKDPFTLMRMIEVNILNTINTVQKAKAKGTKKYFCVSTDKAANPVNMMGASKRIMEMFLMRESQDIPISTARFANVAFSDGSLLHGFNQRFNKQQPIAAPNDVTRYFVVPQEAGELCLASCLLAENRDIFFPKKSELLQLTKFSDIAIRYLENRGFTPHECLSEEEARNRASELIKQKKWPVHFFKSDTTGEKSFEEFFTDGENLNMNRFINLGIIKNELTFSTDKLNKFILTIENMRSRKQWNKQDIVKLFNEMIPNFNHMETGKYLDGKM